MNTAIILAGGLGSRLKSAVSDRQKAVAEVAGEPFLFHIIRQIERTGIRKIVLCTGHKAESVIHSLENHFSELELFFSTESIPLGTAGALRQALDKTDSEELLVMNGDSFYDVDPGELLRWKRKKGVPAAMYLKHVENVSRYGRVATDEQGKVLAFDEKGAFSGAGQINAGIYCFDRSILAVLPLFKKCSLETELFPHLIHQNKLYGLTANGAFIDIGTPESYMNAQHFFERNGIR